MAKIMRGQAMSRRVLVGGAAALGGAWALSGAAALEAAWASEEAPADERAFDGTQYGFSVNVQRCINCGHCVEACRLWNRTAEGEPPRRHVGTYRTEGGREVHISTSCMHCERPACAEVCPAGAIEKVAGGMVRVDDDRCIGCKYCFQACPYGVPHYNARGMDKCDFCTEAGVALGEAPHCVKACKTGALRFGKMDELLAKSPRVRQIDGPGGPSCVLR